MLAPQVTLGVKSGLMVIDVVAVHPPKFIYCIFAFPPELPVINPALSTEAMAGVNEIHGVAVLGNKEPSTRSVPPAQVDVPLGVLMVGNVLT